MEITAWGMNVKRGYTSDPECSRTTSRYRIAQTLLKSQGISPKFPEHADTCMLSPKQIGNRAFGWYYMCDCGVGNSPEPIWPEWVSNEVFQAAWNMSDAIQAARGRAR